MSNLPKQNQRVLLAAVIDGALKESDMRIETVPFDPETAELKEGQVLVANNYVSVDPVTRTFLESKQDALNPGGYMAAIRVGMPIGPRPAVSTVLRSNNENYQPGDMLWCRVVYETYSILDPPLIMRKIAPPTPKYPVTYAIGPLGWIGMTAYFPLIDPLNGNLQPGQTVFVSAAAGAVGQIVCQIAKMIVGPEGKVVASAGSEEKCRWLKETIGVDGVFNYKERDVGEALKELCRNGIHVYYDNVGGQILDATIPHMVLNGRIIACGSVSKYDGQMGAQGVPFKNIDQIVMKRLQMKGFIVVDYLISNHPLVRKFWEDMTKWAEEGKVTMKEDIREGIESFPKAFQDILHGRNDGKLMIHIV